jgi:CubicO group peptidase (beta-lactamase class C family)
VEPGPGTDNPEAIAPAGRVHMTIEDWARYVGLHLEGARGAPRLLSEASFRRLHTAPVGFEYAMGWIVADRAWAKGRVLTHAGSNTLWFCVTWIAPEVDLATLVCSNQGGDAAASLRRGVLGPHRGRAAGARREGPRR